MLSCHHGPRGRAATARWAASRPLWASNTAGHGGAQLILRADGDAILDAPGHVTL
jgi:hypothetical protein